jgi:LAO/AO transport system kinase
LFSRTAGARPTPVLTLSALEERGVDELWSAAEEVVSQAMASGAFEARRRRGRLAWFRDELERALHERWLASPGRADKLAALEELVGSGQEPPSRAVRALLGAHEPHNE